METRLVVLKLFLSHLGVEGVIDTVDKRKEVQKAVYLGQVLSGVDLGYRFGWYLKGPYSPDLTRDYYALDEAIRTGDHEYEGKELVGPVRARLQGVPAVFVKPAVFPRPSADWLELVASYHYLRNISHLDETETRKALKRMKPGLVPHMDLAKTRLREAGFPA